MQYPHMFAQLPTLQSLAHLKSFKMLSAAATANQDNLSTLSSEQMKELQEARLLALQREFIHICREQRSSRAGLFFTLPIILVTTRLA